MPGTPTHKRYCPKCGSIMSLPRVAAQENPAHPSARRISFLHDASSLRYATLGALLRELRWKNSAWLALAETIAGWNGFEIRNAGSGRSPVRKRSG